MISSDYQLQRNVSERHSKEPDTLEKLVPMLFLGVGSFATGFSANVLKKDLAPVYQQYISERSLYDKHKNDILIEVADCSTFMMMAKSSSENCSVGQSGDCQKVSRVRCGGTLYYPDENITSQVNILNSLVDINYGMRKEALIGKALDACGKESVIAFSAGIIMVLAGVLIKRKIARAYRAIQNPENDDSAR